MDAKPNRAATIGYVVSAWPRLSETFILNEVIGVERLGGRVRIFSVKDPQDGPVHAKVAHVRAPVTYLTMVRNRKAIWRANLRQLFRQPGRYARTLLGTLRYRRWKVLRRFFQASYMAELLRHEPLTHLHAHFANDPALVTMLVHQLTGIPFTFTAHAKDIYVKTPPELLRAQAQRAQAVITCTEYNLRYLSTQVGPEYRDKLHCIYHGLDLSQFGFHVPPVFDGVAPVILSVARLVEKKGLSDLISAADILRLRGRRFQIQIVGDGPQRHRLEAQITQLSLNDRVTLLGALPHEKLCRAYQQVSVFALPCVVAADGDRDGIPNALLEAMASGVPVISTPVSGIPELIHQEREGLLVPPNTPVALADAIDRLLTCPELRERLARAARAKIETYFSVDRSSARLLALFQPGGAQ
jgi:glycosyltransferase involved in cell wall biosynthesis